MRTFDDGARVTARSLLPALLAALLAALLLPALADAAPRRDGAAVTKLSLRLGGAAAPVELRFSAKRDARVTISLNGRRPTSPLVQEGGNRFSLPLTARDGLRPGRNTIRIRATRPGGVWDRARRSFTYHSALPIADAGRDHATALGAAVRLGVATLPRAGARPVRNRWTIVKQPRGAKATLRGAATAQPSLVARTPGTYVLRLTARGPGRRAISLDSATVDVRPDDPPLGVAIRTLSSDPAAGVWINGQPQRDTYDRNGIFVVVLNRRTRQVVESGTTPRHGGGVSQLSEIATHWDDDDRYLMVVGAPRGVERGQAASDMRTMLRKIGVGDLRDSDAAALADGKAFSAIGVAGAPGRTAWTNFGGSGELSGLLQLNRLTGTYDFIDPKRVVYDTDVGDASATQTSVVRFDGQRYAASLDPGVSGFHLIAFDGELRKSHEGAYRTDGAAGQKTFADAIKGITAVGDPLLIVQSIGTPKGQSATWNQVVDALRPYGANSLVLNALDGRANSTYALVSRIGMSRAPAESSGKSGGAGQLAGVVARTHAWRWEPQFADQLGEIDPQIVEVAYQEPRAFPAVNAAAKKYVVQQLRFCPSDDPGCDRRPADLRYYYWSAYSSDWTAKLTALGNLRRPEGAAFSDQELSATVAQLQREVSAVSGVKNWVGNLQKPFSRSGAGSLRELEQSARDLVTDLNPPPGSNVVSDMFRFIDEIATSGEGKSEKAAPSATPYFAALAGVSSLVSFLTRRGDPYDLGGDVRTSADRLAGELIERLEDSESALTGIGLLLVSDYGKLTTAEAKIDNDWRVPADFTVAVKQLKLETRRWVSSSLVPVAYPYLVRATPPGRGGGVSDARDLRCKERQADRTVENWTPFPGQGLHVQLRAIEGFESDGVPIEPTFFFTRGYKDTRNFNIRPWPAPTARLAAELFNSPTARTDKGLGIDKLSFYDPRRFGGRLHRANHLAWECDINYLR